MNGQTNTILLAVIAVLLGVQVVAGFTQKNNSAPRPVVGQTQSSNAASQSNPASFDNNSDFDFTNALNEQPAAPSGPLTSVSFDETVYDFGSIPEGIKRTKNFSFTNTGNEPLIITNAKGSCGCTVPDYPRQPIAPGETGNITVEYNSTNRSGNVSNTVTITANTSPAETVLRISANVVKES